MATPDEALSYPSMPHPPHVTPHLIATAVPDNPQTTNAKSMPPSALTTNTYEPQESPTQTVTYGA